MMSAFRASRRLRSPRGACLYTEQLADDCAAAARDERYLRSPAEMASSFADLPELLDNTHELATRLNLELRLGESSLPPIRRPVDDEHHLRRRGAPRPAGASRRNAGRRDAGYAERLDSELGVICRWGSRATS